MIKLGSKKTAAIAAALVVGSWALGAVSFRNEWFPINVYRAARYAYYPPPAAQPPWYDYFGSRQYPVAPVGKIEVACPKAGPRTFTFIATGQSLASNRSMRGEPDFKARDGAVNFLAGKCYRAADPLLGGDNHLGGTPWTRLADELLASGRYDNVVVTLYAQGNTYVKAWAEFAPYTDRPAQLSAELTKAGLAPDAVLRMIGESDAWYGDDVRTTRDEYVAREGQFISELRRKGVTAPIYLAEESRCASQPYEPVASAQRDLVNEAAGIRRGPRIDDIGFDGRWDGCHLSADGRQRAAALWRDVLLSALLAKASLNLSVMLPSFVLVD